MMSLGVHTCGRASQPESLSSSSSSSLESAKSEVAEIEVPTSVATSISVEVATSISAEGAFFATSDVSDAVATGEEAEGGRKPLRSKTDVDHQRDHEGNHTWKSALGNTAQDAKCSKPPPV